MTTAVATAPKPQALTIKHHLNSDAMKAELARVLPTHMSAERMARVAITALTRTPKLQECEQASFFKCLLDLSAMGLEPDGRRAHLIPFENRKRGVVECQLIIDYKGLVELAYRAGVVIAIHADVVREGDRFEYEMGMVMHHVPWFLRRDAGKPKEPGEIYAIYCQVKLKGDILKAEVLSFAEVESLKERGSGWQAFKKGYAKTSPWKTDWNEMAKKTAFRRCSKWIPLSAEIVDAMDRDDDKLPAFGEPTSRVAVSSDLMDRLMSPSDDTHTVDEAHDPAPDDANQDNGEVTMTADDEQEAACEKICAALDKSSSYAERTKAEELAYGEPGLPWTAAQDEKIKGKIEDAKKRERAPKGKQTEMLPANEGIGN